MFNGDFLRKLSSKYERNIRKLISGGSLADDNSRTPIRENDDYLENITLNPKNYESSPVEDFINQNEVTKDRKGVHHHIPSYHPPPLPLPPPLHSRPQHHHHHHTVIDHTITLFSIMLVLGGIFIYLHKLESDVNNNTITLVSNSSFAPIIDINLNTTSDSESSADTSSNVSINGTFPVFVYENGTITNVTFIPIYPGFGWPFLRGGSFGNIGRSMYDSFDYLIQGFKNMIQTVDYE